MLKAALTEKKSAFETVLYGALEAPSAHEDRLFEAMRYSLRAGGKRLRPILLLEACRLCGGTEQQAMPFALAIEMIHTYSLIHDDLPAMDNDDFRRGKPTSHKVFGEGMAVLAGDGLLNTAMDKMLAATLEQGCRRGAVEATAVIARAAGVNGMIAGQAVDLEMEGQMIPLETLEYIHRHKTGALITAALKAGALVADGKPDAIRALTQYGDCIGLTFQIIDDVLDLVGDQEKLGKPIGSDLENEKSTYPKFLGLEGAMEKARCLTQEALTALTPFGEEGLFLKELALDLLKREF